ncbi:MAG: transglutaminase-like domain-containing protein [Methanoregulaceae archaeon]
MVLNGNLQIPNPVSGNTSYQDPAAAVTRETLTPLPPATANVTSAAPPTRQNTPASGTHDSLDRTYTWTYKGTEWSWTGGFAKAGYQYYRNKSHSRESNYAGYALSDYDRQMLQGIVRKFEEAGKEHGYTEYDTIMNIAAFVQSLPYTSDKITTGYDEYPRYPLETLVDGGGDCDDTAILTAALLDELGYGVVLLQLPNHMAVGVKGEDTLSGTYFEYQGSRYYYLETTGTNWDLGEIPGEYANQSAKVLPLVQVPSMEMVCSTKPTGSDAGYFYYRIHCDISNTGVGTARNASLYIAALALSRGEDRVWTPDSTVKLGDYAEGETGYGEATVQIPRNELSRTKCVLSGDNFDPVTLVSAQFRA